jgi:general secretion pathway protein K
MSSPSRNPDPSAAREKLRRRALKRRRRGVALFMVLGALTILTVMLTEFQDGTSAEFGSALSARDALKAEYAAHSAVNLSRLIIATEPTIRKTLAPLFLMMKSPPPQIPVWEFADMVLGAFNDTDGAEKFKTLAGVPNDEGRNLGLEDAGFEVKVIDEDSKININLGARDLLTQNRLKALMVGLLSPAQYDPLFNERDPDGNYSDRQAICGAMIDWVDANQDLSDCDPTVAAPPSPAPEDSYYQLL